MELDIDNIPMIDLIDLWDILTEQERILAAKRLQGNNNDDSRRENSCRIDSEHENQAMQHSINEKGINYPEGI